MQETHQNEPIKDSEIKDTGGNSMSSSSDTVVKI